MQKQTGETEEYIKFTEYKRHQTENFPETGRRKTPRAGSRQSCTGSGRSGLFARRSYAVAVLHGVRTGGSGSASFARPHIERRIPGVVIFCVKVGLDDGKCVAEALKMHDFAFAQELERFAHIRVVDQTKQVVVSRARLLFCCNHIRTTLH